MRTNNLRLITLLFLINAFCSFTYAQIMTVTGVVTDQNNDPICGVSVIIKGMTKGTVTDLDGKYSISCEKGDILIFSFIGFLSENIKVGNNSVINVVLKEDNQRLEEVLVTGYAVQKNNVAAASVSNIVSNRVPGLSVTTYPQARASDESYQSVDENKFKLVKDEPLSTFSVDVDVASYSNMRRFINQGQRPPKDAIRTEELINYFSYDYPAPKGKAPVSITTEVGKCPWEGKHRLVKIGLKAKEIPTENLPLSNFVFLVDVSGSMDDPMKLGLVKSSLKLLVNNLRATDRVAIVVYADAEGVALESTKGDNKQKIREALDGLMAGGSTAGGEGIQLAYKVAKKNFIKGGNNRIILCTDGDFNVGVSSIDGLKSLIEEERKSGVYLSILGYGMGNYKDDKMQTLAQAGNGNHAYIDNLQEANKILVNEFGSTLFTVAKDVKLQIEFNPAKAQAYRLVGYETRLLNNEDFNDDTKDAGDLGAGHTVTAFYEVIPVGVKSKFTSNIDPLKYQKTKDADSPVQTESAYPDLLTVKLRYKEPESSTSEKIEVPLIDNGNNKVSGDFNFAAAVAMFGQLLVDSQFKGDATYNYVISLANRGLNNDPKGYRREFIRLVESAAELSE